MRTFWARACGTGVGIVVVVGLAWRPAAAADLTTTLSKFLVDLAAGTVGNSLPFTKIVVTDSGIATTSTDAAVLTNTTAATSGATVQMSPRLRWRGNAWDTAASETVDFFTEVLPATAATPTGTWKLGYSLNGAAASYPVAVDSTGNVTALNYFIGAGGTLALMNTNSVTFNGGTRTVISAPNDGALNVTANAGTIGSRLKVDALPTVGSGFGSSPSVTAGSTPFAGSVNVGTGGSATSGVITFGGTAFPSTPFCTYSTTSTNAVTRGTPTTTQLTLNSTTAWSASDIVSWICVSAK